MPCRKAKSTVMDATALLLDMTDAAGAIRWLAALFGEYRKIGAHPDAAEIRDMTRIADDIDAATARWLERNREIIELLGKQEQRNKELEATLAALEHGKPVAAPRNGNGK